MQEVWFQTGFDLVSAHEYAVLCAHAFFTLLLAVLSCVSKYFVLKLSSAKAIQRTSLSPRKIWMYTLFLLHAVIGNTGNET